jgi:hypothetical protein
MIKRHCAPNALAHSAHAAIHFYDDSYMKKARRNRRDQRRGFCTAGTARRRTISDLNMQTQKDPLHRGRPRNSSPDRGRADRSRLCGHDRADGREGLTAILKTMPDLVLSISHR